ncbi:hypothetical protein M433DRAFT_182598 [Acidomyces richmondensis BFW]|nr:MAG: hypothetical protein FE78DRAFT_345081 [Acidomyces sp. 'richmondensis']KYG50075.1 hypothetical protein M433DRAFT_182598 [Acidomyces richmondensis BFW]
MPKRAFRRILCLSIIDKQTSITKMPNSPNYICILLLLDIHQFHNTDRNHFPASPSFAIYLPKTFVDFLISLGYLFDCSRYHPRLITLVASSETAWRGADETVVLFYTNSIASSPYNTFEMQLRSWFLIIFKRG